MYHLSDLNPLPCQLNHHTFFQSFFYFQTSDNNELHQSFYRIHATLSPEKTSTHKFVTFINTYQDILSKKKDSVMSRQSKLSKGVSKLQEAKKVVHQLKSEAVRATKLLYEELKLSFCFPFFGCCKNAKLAVI